MYIIYTTPGPQPNSYRPWASAVPVLCVYCPICSVMVTGCSQLPVVVPQSQGQCLMSKLWPAQHNWCPIVPLLHCSHARAKPLADYDRALSRCGEVSIMLGLINCTMFLISPLSSLYVPLLSTSDCSKYYFLLTFRDKSPQESLEKLGWIIVSATVSLAPPCT